MMGGGPLRPRGAFRAQAGWGQPAPTKKPEPYGSGFWSCPTLKRGGALSGRGFEGLIGRCGGGESDPPAQVGQVALRLAKFGGDLGLHELVVVLLLGAKPAFAQPGEVLFLAFQVGGGIVVTGQFLDARVDENGADEAGDQEDGETFDHGRREWRVKA